MTPCPCCGQYPTAASMQQQIADYIKTNPGVKRQAIMTDLGLSTTDCSNWLNRVKEQRMAYATGRGPMAKWFPGEKTETIRSPKVNSVWAMGAV